LNIVIRYGKVGPWALRDGKRAAFTWYWKFRLAALIETARN
jgi:hypothetical protein